MMTPEEKAKAYDEALEKSKRLYEQGTITESLAYIFPELKESGDERIRKALLELVRQSSEVLDRQNQNNMIVWLRKQGEQKLANSCKICKAEPKFKVGDWILYSGDHYEGVRHITKINENGYYIERNGLPHGIIPFNHEICMRLWTIQDAKNGDVLVASDESLFIFARAKDNAAYYHFSLCKNGSQEISDGKHAWEVAKDCHPATKEQRDLLSSKMREAGYEWDAENKELKKISQRMISAEAKEAMYDKPAWSEEDNKHYQSCLNYFEEIKPDSVFYKDYLWFKSLKERIERR